MHPRDHQLQHERPDRDAAGHGTGRDATHSPTGDDLGTMDRGDLADASQAEATRFPDDLDARTDAPDPWTDRRDRPAGGSEPAPADGPEFHEPAPVPTAFGATTVAGAVAASALASGNPADERDPRDEETARPGDGLAEDRIDDIDGRT